MDLYISVVPECEDLTLKPDFVLPYSYLLWNLPCFLTVTFWLDASSSKRDLKPSWFIWGFSLQRGLLKSLGKVFNLTVTGSCVSLALHCSMPAACMHWCIAVIKAEQISQACENELMGLSLHHLVMPAFPLGWGILTCLHIFSSTYKMMFILFLS